MTSGWLKIGKIGKAHGLRGAFFVRGREDLIPLSYKSVRIGADPSQALAADLVASTWQGREPLLKVSIAKDRSAAEALTGQDIWVERSRVDVDDTEEFLWDDLEGRELVDCVGAPVGRLIAVYNTGAADIAVIENDDRGQLEIALVDTYFDLNFDDAGPLRLVVPSAMFDEFWQTGNK